MGMYDLVREGGVGEGEGGVSGLGCGCTGEVQIDTAVGKY